MSAADNNEADARIDFPADPGCLSAADNNEAIRYDSAEREAAAASLAALRGLPWEIGISRGDDPQPVVWWVIALGAIAVGGVIAGMASATGHAYRGSAKIRLKRLVALA